MGMVQQRNCGINEVSCSRGKHSRIAFFQSRIEGWSGLGWIGKLYGLYRVLSFLPCLALDEIRVPYPLVISASVVACMCIRHLLIFCICEGVNRPLWAISSMMKTSPCRCSCMFAVTLSLIRIFCSLANFQTSLIQQSVRSDWNKSYSSWKMFRPIPISTFPNSILVRRSSADNVDSWRCSVMKAIRSAPWWIYRSSIPNPPSSVDPNTTSRG